MRVDRGVAQIVGIRLGTALDEPVHWNFPLHAADQPRLVYLCELALDFALRHLRPGGTLVVKIFQGEGFDAYLRALRCHFRQVISRKPRSSRRESRELYLVARDLTAREDPPGLVSG